MRDGFLVVDDHVHTFSTDEVALKVMESFNKIYDIEFVNPGTGSISDVLGKMEEFGIDFTIMANFASPKILHRNNLWALETAKECRSLIPLVSFHPEMEGSLTQLLEQYVEEGAKGLKIHPMAQGYEPNHPGMQDVYRLCSERALPIEFHCGRVSNARLNEYSDVETILPVIDAYPGIPIILTHMADGNVEDVERLSKSYENVYFDTSIVVTGYPSIARVNEPSWLDDDFVIDVINSIGAEKVLFGSDYPWGSNGHDLDRFMKMKLDDDKKRLVLGENAVKLFRIDV